MSHKPLLVIIVGIGCGWALFSLMTRGDKTGDVNIIQLDNQKVLSTVRGRVEQKKFRIENTHGFPIRIKAIQTGCGCAAATVNEEPVLDKVVGANESLDFVMTVDTSARYGYFNVPCRIYYETPNKNANQELYEVAGNFELEINPGWSVDQKLVFLSSTDKSKSCVVLFQVGDVNLEVVGATIDDSRVQYELKPYPASSTDHHFELNNVTADLREKLKVVPKYIVEIGIDATQVKDFIKARIQLNLAGNLQPVHIDVQFSPNSQIKNVLPKSIVLPIKFDRPLNRELIIKGVGSDDWEIALPTNVKLVESTRISNSSEKVVLTIDPDIDLSQKIKVTTRDGTEFDVTFDRN